MCVFNKPRAPEAPKPIVPDVAAEPVAPELGGENEEQKQRKAQRTGIRSLRTDIGTGSRIGGGASGVSLGRIRQK